MAAHSEVFLRDTHALDGAAEGLPARPSATILRLRGPESQADRLIERTSGDRLGPAQGLVTGLCLGAVLWAGVAALAWKFLLYR